MSDAAAAGARPAGGLKPLRGTDRPRHAVPAHSRWVPALGWKQDAIPGIINDQWTLVKEPGIYRGQCAELCGKDHGFMPIVVEVKPKAEFEQWLAAQQAANDVPAANIAATDTAEPAAADAAPTQG